MCFRNRNTAVNEPRSATMNIPMDSNRQHGAREVERGQISGIRDSKIAGQKMVHVGARLYYVEKRLADCFKLEVGQTVKIVHFQEKYYLSTVSDRRPRVSRELQQYAKRR